MRHWTKAAERALEERRWPGNVRQLANIIEQAYVLDCEPRLPESMKPDIGW